MFNLNDILQNAQGGNAVGNLAQRFGLSPDQTNNAIQALIPALSAALQNKAGDPGALGSIISAMTDKDHQASFSNPDAAPHPDAVAKGQDVLGDLFGSSNVTNQVAQQISNVTGLRPDLLTQLLPAVTSIALGGMAQSFHNQGLGGLLGQLAGAAQQGNLGSMLGQNPQNPQSPQTAPDNSGGGLMGLVTSVLGGLLGGGNKTPDEPAAPQAGLETLTKMFQPGTSSGNFDQAGLQDAIGAILGGKR
jgi:hypothetical protein